MSGYDWPSKLAAVERALYEVRGELAYLVGFYGHRGNGDGAVPVEKLRPLVPALAAADAATVDHIEDGAG